MRAIIQRVSEASVKIENKTSGKIKIGFLVLVGYEDTDNDEDIDWLCRKIVQLRIFNDNNGLMNLPLSEVNGDILLVSQFTLYANTKKGNRPSYIKAAKPEIAISLYEKTIQQFQGYIGKPIQTGIFGADMKVSLVNDGPVTIFIDTKEKE